MVKTERPSTPARSQHHPLPPPKMGSWAVCADLKSGHSWLPQSYYLKGSRCSCTRPRRVPVSFCPGEKKHTSNAYGNRHHLCRDPSNEVRFDEFVISKRKRLCEVLSEKTKLQIWTSGPTSWGNSIKALMCCHARGSSSDGHLPPSLSRHQI